MSDLKWESGQKARLKNGYGLFDSYAKQFGVVEKQSQPVKAKPSDSVWIRFADKQLIHTKAGNVTDEPLETTT